MLPCIPPPQGPSLDPNETVFNRTVRDYVFMCFPPSFLRSRALAVTRITKSSYCRFRTRHKPDPAKHGPGMAVTPGALRGGLPATLRPEHPPANPEDGLVQCARVRPTSMQSTTTHTRARNARTVHPRTKSKKTEPQSASCSIAPEAEPAAAPAPPPLLLALPFPAEPFCRTSGPSPW